jgi:archaeal type IV pilus assembly protein PilA
VQPGDSATLTITVPKTMTAGANAFASGQTLEITLHSTGGKDYPKVVTLP